MISTDAENLPRDVTTCHALILELLETVRGYEKKLGHMQHTIDELLRQRFGRKSERLENIDPAELLPFIQDYLEAYKKQEEQQEQASEPEKETITYERTKSGHGRKPIPDSLERERVVHDLDDSEKTCGCCGEPLVRIGEETSEQLEFIPARLFAIEHVQLKYACKGCEGHIALAPKPRQPIEKGLAGPSLLAHIMTSRFADHLPYYRQATIFERHGIEIPRSTQCDWIIQVGEVLRPLLRLMIELTLQSKVIGTDDTTVKVRDETLDKKTRTGRLWVYRGDDEHPYVVYDYTPTRERAGPEAFLRDYQEGFLQADAYAGYDRIYKDEKRNVQELLCWAHARRKFYEARRSDPELSHSAIAMIKLLYEVEKEIKDLPAEKKVAVRQEKSVPILRDMKAWLEGIPLERALPQSPIRQAINYALNGWEALCRYTEDGAFAIDNNATERLMRPVAIGRKNWICVSRRRCYVVSIRSAARTPCSKLDGGWPSDQDLQEY
ncbi:IS66 family transposase [Candidatus Uhrbacteria bacterium]|nr:IS66 family transposase [Candidatus Uhrbacteria bacterium]